MGGDHGHDHGHGHGHHVKIGESKYNKVPDYRIYKVSDAPELVTVQRMLAQKGLKDPWLRNHVWMYLPRGPDGKLSMSQKFFRFMFQGFKYGLAATVVTVALEEGYKKLFPSSHDEHGHH